MNVSEKPIYPLYRSSEAISRDMSNYKPLFPFDLENSSTDSEIILFSCVARNFVSKLSSRQSGTNLVRQRRSNEFRHRNGTSIKWHNSWLGLNTIWLDIASRMYIIWLKCTQFFGLNAWVHWGFVELLRYYQHLFVPSTRRKPKRGISTLFPRIRAGFGSILHFNPVRAETTVHKTAKSTKNSEFFGNFGMFSIETTQLESNRALRS